MIEEEGGETSSHLTAGDERECLRVQRACQSAPPESAAAILNDQNTAKRQKKEPGQHRHLRYATFPQQRKEREPCKLELNPPTLRFDLHSAA